MKFANRFGDQRANFYKKEDNLKIGTNFYQIVGVRDLPQLGLDLGTVALGSFVTPTQGTKVPFSELEPTDDNLLTHVLIGVPDTKFAVGVVHSLSSAPAGNVDMADGKSCQVRYWNPQEQPQWLSPQGHVQEYLDHRVSPMGDENELFPIFVKKGQIPYFRADNPNPDGPIDQFIFAVGKMYKLVLLTTPPTYYAVIPTLESVCGI